MTRTSLSLFNKLRPYSIGFDNAFDSWDRFFTDDFNLTSAMTSSFPAYDIIKKNEHQYQIQLALAGFSKDDIEVEVKENVLSIRSKEKTDEAVDTADGNVLQKELPKGTLKEHSPLQTTQWSKALNSRMDFFQLNWKELFLKQRKPN